MSERAASSLDTRLLDADAPGDVAEAVRLLRAGRLVAVPTETVYGLAGNAADPAAVRAIFAAKGRPTDHPLIVHLADAAAMPRWARDIPADAWTLADAFWPGPLTLVVPATPAVPAALLAVARNIAVRVPASEVARALARQVGPLVSTSANLAGEPPCLTVDQALQAFPAAVLVIDVGALDGAPSTIVDVTDSNGAVTVLRDRQVR